MHWYDVYRARRAAQLSQFEEHALITGLLLIPTAAVAALAGEEAGGFARLMGSFGLIALVICAASRGFRLYRAGMRAALPTAVARVPVRIRPARALSLSTVALALGLPLASGVALVVLVEWGWLAVAGVLLLGCACVFASWVREVVGEAPYSKTSAEACELLARLCMRADMPVPELVVEPGAVANAWTSRGRVHVTRRLLTLLDTAELEAVLAHEVAHLARRDAAVMEICSAPSRVLLAFAGQVGVRLGRSMHMIANFSLTASLAVAALAVLCLPPAYAIGWISRLSLLGMSRAREHAADAVAVTLTGRPSALASALMKLDGQREWVPRADLRQAAAHAVLCIVGTGGPGWLSTHPATAKRVKRLAQAETRIQAGPYRASGRARRR